MSLNPLAVVSYLTLISFSANRVYCCITARGCFAPLLFVFSQRSAGQIVVFMQLRQTARRALLAVGGRQKKARTSCEYQPTKLNHKSE